MSETKLFSPPRTKPLVAIAEVERPVIVVTKTAIRTIAHDRAGEEEKNNVFFTLNSVAL